MIKFVVNGKEAYSEQPGDTPLLWVVRDELGLTGTKFGCGVAQCGACTVHINGTESTASVRTPRLPAIGRSKNAMKRPSALIIELMKFSSSIAPSTIPRIAGATGKPFSSIR